jgi:hypothetical protein
MNGSLTMARAASPLGQASASLHGMILSACSWVQSAAGIADPELRRLRSCLPAGSSLNPVSAGSER